MLRSYPRAAGMYAKWNDNRVRTLTCWPCSLNEKDLRLNSNSDPRRKQSSTIDAWLMLGVACGLYVVSQALFTKVSILGGTAAGQILFFLLPAFLYAKWKSGSVVEALRLRPVASGTSWRVVLLAITFIGVGSLLTRATKPLMEQYFGDLIPVFETLMGILTPESATGLVGNLLVVGLLAPICEEVLYRGAFQGSLERCGPTQAILISALMFTLLHLNPFGFLEILLIGILLGWVTWRTQSLWPAILWHAVNNATATVLFYFGGESFSMPIWLEAALAVAFIVPAWEFIRYTSRDAPAKPGPLATATPLLGRLPSRFVAAVGLLVAILLITLATCFGRVRLATNHLTPDYSQGDIAIYTRGPVFRFERLRPGDVIVYRGHDGRLYIRRVKATDGDQVSVAVSGGGSDEVIAREAIKGKTIWKFDPGEEIKRIVQEISDGRAAPEE